MLVLTQKVGDAVLLGSDITVRVLSVDGDQVRIGYEAPKSLNIIRETLKNKLEAQGVEVRPEKDNVIRPRYREQK